MRLKTPVVTYYESKVPGLQFFRKERNSLQLRFLKYCLLFNILTMLADEVNKTRQVLIKGDK